MALRTQGIRSLEQRPRRLPRFRLWLVEAAAIECQAQLLIEKGIRNCAIVIVGPRTLMRNFICPDQRFKASHPTFGRSRLRKFRSYGSARAAGRKARPYRDRTSMDTSWWVPLVSIARCVRIPVDVGR